MDIQFWIWLIIIVVTFVSRAMKKAKTPEAPQQPRTNSDNEHSPDHKPMTFEELLREIQGSKTPPQHAEVKRQPVDFRKPAPLPKSYEVDYDDEIEEEEKNYETIPSSDDRSYEVYEQAKREAFKRPSLEDTLKLEDTVMKFGHFKEYDETLQRSLAREVLQDLKNPDGFRKAFIMSEILKRKF